MTLTLWSLSTAALYAYVKNMCVINKGLQFSTNVALFFTRIAAVDSEETKETFLSLPLLHPSHAFTTRLFYFENQAPI